MTGVTLERVTSDESGIRLDRWFKRHYPGLSHVHLQKLLRSGQVRVDGGRAKAGLRLEEGQSIRIPPFGEESLLKPDQKRSNSNLQPDDKDLKALHSSILFKDDSVIVINKPPGLAVQGGTGLRRHLDAMLDSLRFDSQERPRLVHRLDKDTSGVLLLARTAAAASHLTAAFRSRDARKLYWALVVGVPKPARGKIDLPLSKLPGSGGERMAPDPKGGKKAVTLYSIVEQAGRKVSWLAMEPLTGRTHQLRVHALALETPILGDGKYGGTDAFLQGHGISRKLHLHARAIRVPHPRQGILEVTAPLPEHMAATWAFLGFDENNENSGFLEEDAV
ncbi:MAG: RluA family pseudouridine synthase [Rhodospirillales bacterium]|nr:RluA family pseudouridine synthase [Rhodospirillales bacterium]